MIESDKIKTLFTGPKPLPLYAAAFFQSCSGGIWLVAMPFIIKRLGGSDTQLGLCLGLAFAAYMIGCVSAGSILDRFNAKNVVQFGAAANALVNIAVMITVIIAQNNHHPASLLWVIICLSMLGGLLGVFFWPPLMGWLSTGYEGAKLNRRLGIFNVVWSFGALITPYLGGVLVERSSTWPFIAMITFALFGFVSISMAKSPKKDSSIDENIQTGKMPSDIVLELLPRFRWMARIALLTSFVCIGLVRTQLAVLFKYELKFLESSYGTAMMIMCLVVFIIFIAAGKTHQWHYKLNIFIIAQLALLASMLIIMNSSSLGTLFIAVALVGVGQAFMYSSHLYYGVSGGTKRSGRMAMHEILLSVGFVIGASVGGAISDLYGPYMPYWLGFTIVTLGLAIQTVIWFALKPKTPKPG